MPPAAAVILNCSLPLLCQLHESPQQPPQSPAGGAAAWFAVCSHAGWPARWPLPKNGASFSRGSSSQHELT